MSAFRASAELHGASASSRIPRRVAFVRAFNTERGRGQLENGLQTQAAIWKQRFVVGVLPQLTNGSRQHDGFSLITLKVSLKQCPSGAPGPSFWPVQQSGITASRPAAYTSPNFFAIRCSTRSLFDSIAQHETARHALRISSDRSSSSRCSIHAGNSTP